MRDKLFINATTFECPCHNKFISNGTHVIALWLVQYYM